MVESKFELTVFGDEKTGECVCCRCGACGKNSRVVRYVAGADLCLHPVRQEGRITRIHKRMRRPPVVFGRPYVLKRCVGEKCAVCGRKEHFAHRVIEADYAVSARRNHVDLQVTGGIVHAEVVHPAGIGETAQFIGRVVQFACREEQNICIGREISHSAGCRKRSFVIDGVAQVPEVRDNFVWGLGGKGAACCMTILVVPVEAKFRTDTKAGEMF